MTTTTQPAGRKRAVKKCQGIVVEGGMYRRRWIHSITLHVHGRVPRTLKGAQLPDTIVLDTGVDQQAESVLEFFYDDMPSLRFQPEVSWTGGRAAATAIGAIVAFQVFWAVVNAVSAAVIN